MLLVTAFLNFILSKKDKSATPKAPQGRDPSATERGGSFLHMVPGRRVLGPPVTPRHGGAHTGEEGESIQAMLETEREHTTVTVPKEKQRESRGWRETRQVRFTSSSEGPVEREMEEMESYRDAEPETTSDTATLITD